MGARNAGVAHGGEAGAGSGAPGRFYLHEESKEELCEMFGLSDLHFNRVIFRARERFRELLSRRGLGRADFLSILAVF
jgi:hypothetical protein